MSDTVAGMDDRKPSPFELWKRVGGDREKYLALMAEHGHIVPGRDAALDVFGHRVDFTEAFRNAETFDVLRLLPEERPLGYDRLSDDEKAVRGRYFLMVYAMGASEPYAWFNALSAQPEHNREMRAIVATVNDADILAALRDRDDPARPELPA